ncbi:MAG: magnesium transporter CorA, partial [Rhodoferax sp.]
MRIFHIQHSSVTERPAREDLSALALPDQGYVWLSCSRHAFEQGLAPIQAMLQRLCGVQLVDLHISDLLNQQLPSHYDYT